MDKSIIENTGTQGRCKDCNFYIPQKGRMGWCKLCKGMKDQAQSCSGYRRPKERIKKCQDCVRYKAINNSMGRCKGYLGKVRSDSTCKRFIKKGRPKL